MIGAVLGAIVSMLETAAAIISEAIEAAVEFAKSVEIPIPSEEIPQEERGIPPRKTDTFVSAAKSTYEKIKKEFPESLRKDIHMRFLEDSAGLLVGVKYWATNKIIAFLEYGTGIYGPNHQRITAKIAKALHFKESTIAKALGFPTDDVFLHSVRGIRGRYAMTKACLDLKLLYPNMQIEKVA